MTFKITIGTRYSGRRKVTEFATIEAAQRAAAAIFRETGIIVAIEAAEPKTERAA